MNSHGGARYAPSVTIGRPAPRLLVSAVVRLAKKVTPIGLSLPLRRVSSMIDFQNASYVKLSQVDLGQVADQINPLLIEGEQAFVAYKGMRDYVVFTSKRIIAVNVQGITGKKKDFTSLPLAKIQAFSVETAGTFDLDAELELWFSGLGKVKFEFSGKTDVAYLNKLVAHHVL